MIRQSFTSTSAHSAQTDAIIARNTDNLALRARLAPLLCASGLALTLVGALVLRLISAMYDYPFMFEVDETRVVQVTLTMMAAHSIDPHYYAYGPFLIYLEALWLLPYLAVHALLSGHAGIPIVYSYGSGMGTITDPYLHVYGRLLFVVLGVATVWLAFLCGRALGGRWVGLLAAVLLALSPLHTLQSAYVLPNAPTSFFALLTLWATIKAIRDVGPLPNRWPGWLSWTTPYWLLATSAASLGAAIKYNAVVLVGIPLLAVIMSGWSDGRSAWLSRCLRLCIVSLAVFLVVTPPALFTPVAFVHGAGYELKHYALIGGGGTEDGPSIIWYGRYLVQNEGWLVLPVALIGLIVRVIRQRRVIDTLLLVTIVGYYLLIGIQKVHFDRNLLVILPLLSVAAAYMIGALISWVRPWGIVISITVSALIVIPLVQSAATQVAWERAPQAQIVTRTWLQQHLPIGAHIALDGYTVPGIGRRDVVITSIESLYPRPDTLWLMGVRYVVLGHSLWFYQNMHFVDTLTMLMPIENQGIPVYQLVLRHPSSL